MAAHGFRGALNWYRNFERNWQLSEPLQGQKIVQPTLFLIGDHDPVGKLEAYTLKKMPEWVPTLEQQVLDDCGPGSRTSDRNRSTRTCWPSSPGAIRPEDGCGRDRLSAPVAG